MGKSGRRDGLRKSGSQKKTQESGLEQKGAAIREREAAPYFRMEDGGGRRKENVLCVGSMAHLHDNTIERAFQQRRYNTRHARGTTGAGFRRPTPPRLETQDAGVGPPLRPATRPRAANKRQRAAQVENAPVGAGGRRVLLNLPLTLLDHDHRLPNIPSAQDCQGRDSDAQHPPCAVRATRQSASTGSTPPLTLSNQPNPTAPNHE